MEWHITNIVHLDYVWWLNNIYHNVHKEFIKYVLLFKCWQSLWLVNAPRIYAMTSSARSNNQTKNKIAELAFRYCMQHSCGSYIWCLTIWSLRLIDTIYDFTSKNAHYHSYVNNNNHVSDLIINYGNEWRRLSSPINLVLIFNYNIHEMVSPFWLEQIIAHCLVQENYACG